MQNLFLASDVHTVSSFLGFVLCAFLQYYLKSYQRTVIDGPKRIEQIFF